jgi:conjugative relaxase-like TrwC/TraI family protein
MLSLWKLRVGVEAYYLAQVASGLDEYYTGAGEAIGRWTGASSASLGLAGDVVPDDLRAVLAGLAPGTALTPNGDRLTTRPRRVPGFDLTFSVPKSVSVVYALGDPLVQQAVVEGCEAALAEALAWLEREACFVRRGTNNRAMAERDGVQFGTRRMAADGFVAAQFRHRTSRAGDPHLHWHVLVANVARGIDGRWSALDGTALYRAQRTAGVVFQVAMRRELTARLGVEWGPTHRDAADIAGIPARVLEGSPPVTNRSPNGSTAQAGKAQLPPRPHCWRPARGSRCPPTSTPSKPHGVIARSSWDGGQRSSIGCSETGRLRRTPRLMRPGRFARRAGLPAGSRS